MSRAVLEIHSVRKQRTNGIDVIGENFSPAAPERSVILPKMVLEGYDYQDYVPTFEYITLDYD